MCKTGFFHDYWALYSIANRGRLPRNFSRKSRFFRKTEKSDQIRSDLTIENGKSHVISLRCCGRAKIVPRVLRPLTGYSSDFQDWTYMFQCTFLKIFWKFRISWQKMRLETQKTGFRGSIGVYKQKTTILAIWPLLSMILLSETGINPQNNNKNTFLWVIWGSIRGLYRYKRPKWRKNAVFHRFEGVYTGIHRKYRGL